MHLAVEPIWGAFLGCLIWGATVIIGLFPLEETSKCLVGKKFVRAYKSFTWLYALRIYDINLGPPTAVALENKCCLFAALSVLYTNTFVLEFGADNSINLSPLDVIHENHLL